MLYSKLQKAIWTLPGRPTEFCLIQSTISGKQLNILPNYTLIILPVHLKLHLGIKVTFYYPSFSHPPSYLWWQFYFPAWHVKPEIFTHPDPLPPLLVMRGMPIQHCNVPLKPQSPTVPLWSCQSSSLSWKDPFIGDVDLWKDPKAGHTI